MPAILYSEDSSISILITESIDVRAIVNEVKVAIHYTRGIYGLLLERREHPLLDFAGIKPDNAFNLYLRPRL